VEEETNGPLLAICSKRTVSENKTEKMAQALFEKLISDVEASEHLHRAVAKRPRLETRVNVPKGTNVPEFDFEARVRKSVEVCRTQRDRMHGDGPSDVSDEQLYEAARHTDEAALAPFQPFLRLVPRLVNIVRSFDRVYRTPCLSTHPSHTTHIGVRNGPTGDPCGSHTSFGDGIVVAT
jgi:hypothetical protein